MTIDVRRGHCVNWSTVLQLLWVRLQHKSLKENYWGLLQHIRIPSLSHKQQYLKLLYQSISFTEAPSKSNQSCHCTECSISASVDIYTYSMKESCTLNKPESLENVGNMCLSYMKRQQNVKTFSRHSTTWRPVNIQTGHITANCRSQMTVHSNK